MRILQSAEAKTHFSSILKDVKAGNEVAIAYGREKKTIAVIIPYEKWKKKPKKPNKAIGHSGRQDDCELCGSFFND
jgi:antitoxin (DNA-binding transcriptional repressor) of toxin-antitoxin stability system